ncbi:hypothetical protein BT96DRAFT_1003537 [Gymnopus androsaceus JB14]|uniref:Uncharacterized protein n=1 Tax=Gymnopus androsaceus JB14 TaxID=1447944 RepID=A0A6A4GUY2_9AGAR|nr:hypothetical protein BT96DRAFT_1003537 [Gymnopus androsaceus JB14]
MKECIPQLENTAGQLLALDGEITTFSVQSGGTPSSACCSKCKRDSTDPTTPSKAITLQPFPLASDNNDDKGEFVEGPSKPISPKISCRTSLVPVAGSSSLWKIPALASPTKIGDSNSRWMLYLSHTCDELEEAANSNGIQDTILGPKLRALAQTIYNNC